jgi:hypothetical protein
MNYHRGLHIMKLFLHIMNYNKKVTNLAKIGCEFVS